MQIGKYWCELRGQGMSAVYCFYACGKRAKAAGTNLVGQLPAWKIPLLACKAKTIEILTTYAANL